MSFDMHNVLLVARREFRQIAAMRSFWLTLLLVPVALALGPVLGRFLGDEDATRVVLLDRSGTDTGAAIRARFAQEQDRETIAALARYVRRYDLAAADPQALWAQPDRWYSEPDIAAFNAAGGLAAAQARLRSVRDDDTPGFDAPTPAYAFVAAPPALANAAPTALAAAADGVFDSDADGDEAIDLIVSIGADYPTTARVALFANDRPGSRFVTLLQDVLTADLRQRLLAAQGVAPGTARAIDTATPDIAITTPPPGGGAREAMLVRSIVPLALAYILMMSLMLSGNWMLQGSIEERSNKLIESLLACIRPADLMYGKLLGALAIGMSMLLVWFVCAALAVFAMQGAVADFLRPALAPINTPGAIVAIVYFFLAGYISISILFLAIGAMSDSMSDAQGFLMPVVLAILLPITFLIQAVLLDKGGIAVELFTWIPLWTPFAVLARLGAGIATWKTIGAGVLLAGFIALELVALGRLFRHSLLSQGQKPSLSGLVARLRTPSP